MSQDRIQELEAQLAQREQELRRLQEELTEAGKFSLIGQISAEAAHEINNPLGAIRIHVEELIRDLKKGQFQATEAEESLKIINHNIQRVTHAVKGLREISRGLDDHYALIDLNHVLHHAAQIMRKPLEKEGIFLEEGYYSTPLELWGNSNKLEQLISNLVINARDAILSEKPSCPKIIIRTFLCDDGYVGFEIIDNGGGVAPEVQDKIFTPFFTTKAPGHGVGLGLSIVRRIADEHRARMEMRTSSQGTCFHFRFPKDRRLLARPT